MSSVTLKTFVVIKTKEDSPNSDLKANSLYIIKGKDIKGWCRDKWPAGVDWPQNPLWQKEDEESTEDVRCTILHVNTKQECDSFVKNYSEPPADSIQTNQSYITVEQYEHLKNEICDLREDYNQMKFEFKSWRDACLPDFAVKSKLIQVANHEGWYVCMDLLALCVVSGANETGFRKLFLKVFTEKDKEGKLDYFPGQSWKTLSMKETEKVEDLMALFVLHCYAQQNRAEIKPSYKTDLYLKIHTNIVNHLNQRNYRKKKATGSADISIVDETKNTVKKRRNTKETSTTIESLARVEKSLAIQNNFIEVDDHLGIQDINSIDRNQLSPVSLMEDMSPQNI